MKQLSSPLPLLLTLIICCIGCGDGGDNNRFSEAIQGKTVQYTALGASDAVGVGAEPLTNGYVYQIERALEEDGAEVELDNLGIPGAEADEIKELELPLATTSNPDIVTLFIGANDVVAGRSIESFEADVQAILRTLKSETSAFIVIANLPQLTKLPRFRQDPDPDVTQERENAFNEAIERQAQLHGISLVRLSDITLTDNLISEDGFHPNNSGYEVITEQYLRIIRQEYSSSR